MQMIRDQLPNVMLDENTKNVVRMERYGVMLTNTIH